MISFLQTQYQFVCESILKAYEGMHVDKPVVVAVYVVAVYVVAVIVVVVLLLLLLCCCCLYHC